MLISARAACELLAWAGLARQQALLVLRTGLAGEPVLSSNALLYDDARVRALAARPAADPARLAMSCPRGLFVVRLGRRPGTEGPRGPWDLSPWTRVLLVHQIGVAGYFPLVVTVAGFVVEGAAIVGLSSAASGFRTGRPATRLDVAPPDACQAAWFEALRGTRLALGRGGPWVLWEPRRAHRWAAGC